jgi:hypothetical protein
MFVNALSGLGIIAQETSSSPTFLGHGGMVSGPAGVPYPSGIQEGDFLILSTNSGSALAPVTTTISGWTNYNIVVSGVNPVLYSVFYRVADGSESGTLSLGISENHRYLMTAYRAVGSHSAQGGTSTGLNNGSHSFLSLTTTNNGALLVYQASRRGDTTIPPFTGSPFLTNADLTTITNIFNERTTDGNGGGFGMATGIKESAGFVQSSSFSANTGNGVTAPWLIVMYP